MRWTYYREDGKEFDFRTYPGSWPDDPELLVQGRLQENVRRKHKMNSLMCFADRKLARKHFDKVA